MAIEAQSTLIPTNLPTSLTPLVGRHAEKAALLHVLSDSPTRMVTLLAPGGMGKTHLALEVAREQLGEFSEGVYWVTLSTFVSVDEFAILVADAINCQIYLDQNIEEQVLNNLSHQQLLLVIDNAEYSLRASAFLTDILRTAPYVKILAVSQVKLNLYVERVFSLGGLSFATVNPNADEVSDAVTLFIERSRSVRPDLQLTPKSREAIDEICRLTQGMPLALVLAASWTALLSPEEIVHELKYGFDFLESDIQDMPERQRSIRAIFDYTWSLMSDDERRLLTRLSIFRRGFTREAAKSVAQGDLRSLMSLLNRAVIQSSSHDGRIEIHEMLRLYAEEQLERSGDFDALRSIHSQYYLDLIKQHEHDLKGTKQIEVLNLLQADEENISLALQWAIKHHETQSLSDSLEGLFWYQLMRNRYLIFEAISHNITAEFSKSFREVDVLLVARTQLRYWWMVRWSEGTFARHPEIIEKLEKLMLQLRDLDADREVALCELLLGDAVRTLQKDLERGRSLLKSAYDTFVRLGDEYYAAWTLHFIAKLQSDTQGVSNGIDSLNGALALRRKLGDQVGAMYSLYNLSTDLLLLGQVQRCREITEEILGISRITGEQSTMLLGHINLTILAFFDGHLEEVRTQNEMNAALAAKLNHVLGQSWTRLIQVFVDYLDGNINGLAESLALSEKVAVQSIIGYFTDLAYPFMQYSDRAYVTECLNSALNRSVEFAAPGAQRLCLPFLAAFEAERERYVQAAQLLALAERQPSSIMGWLPKWLQRTSLKKRIEQKLTADTLDDAYEDGQKLDVESVIRSFLRASPEQATIDSPIAAHILQANSRLIEPLSERELEVLAYICKGLSNQEIANEMVVELSTIKKHLTHIYGKLDVGTRSQAILRSQELGLI
jgi:predicted ATPase/DNA-binding CsgD family transcriptional regulator